MPNSTVLIIGGGAAGLTAAIAAAREGASVTVLEAKPRVGSKILATGNGRCNLSNKKITSSAYNDAGFVSPVLSKYTSENIVSFFEGLGLVTYSDDEGRIYPISNNASSVLDVLRLECTRLGVKIECDFKVEKLSGEPSGESFIAFSDTGRSAVGDAVVVTTGGGTSLLADFGHKVEKFEPVLVPIRTDTEPIRGLSGVRVRCAASIIDKEASQNDVARAEASTQNDFTGANVVATERGEILFRDYGVSGIMIFDLSRFLGKGQTLSIDFLPDMSMEELIQKLSARRNAFSARTAETFLTGMFHARVAGALLRAARINPKTPAREISCEQLALTIKNFTLAITGAGDPKQAQVTRGGASTQEFNPETLESMRKTGVFAAGEALDVDGRCGGYNLHWAWSSGLEAGESAAHFALAQSASAEVIHE